MFRLPGAEDGTWKPKHVGKLLMSTCWISLTWSEWIVCFAHWNPELDHVSSVTEEVEFLDVNHSELNSDRLITEGLRHEMSVFGPSRIFCLMLKFVNKWETPVYLGTLVQRTGACLLVFNIYSGFRCYINRTYALQVVQEILLGLLDPWRWDL
jgi:hypothetical protein